MKFSITIRILILTGWALALLWNGCEGQKRDKRHPDFEAAITHKNLGIAYLEEEKPGAALNEFKKVMALAPDQALGYANFGLAYLRLNEPESAKSFIDKALEVDPDNADVYLLKAEVYYKLHQTDEAIEAVQKALEYAPENLEALYKLYRLLSTQRKRPESLELAQQQLERLYKLAPNNLVLIVKWASQLAEKSLYEQAQKVLEELRSPIWNFDQKSLDYLEQAFEHLNQKDSKQAVTKLTIFENLQKPSPRYQQSIGELQTNVVGLPVLDFGEDFYLKKKIEFPPPIPVQFVLVTKDAGLEIGTTVQHQEARLKDGLPPPGDLSFGDVDNDGDPDLFVCRSRGGNKLFRNNSGKFEDVTARSGMKQTRSNAALFVDYNNDKWLDLYLVNSGPNILLQNDGARFVDVTDANKIGDPNIGAAALFFDYDHEGDLDLVLCNWSSSNKIYRNNLDGTFDDVTEASGLLTSASQSVESFFADFDDDGDTDFIILNRDAAPELYMNLRQGRVAEATAAWGLSSINGGRAGAVADFDNDGFVDLILCSKAGIAYYKNLHGKRFEKKDTLGPPVSGVSNDAAVLDYDNDGWVDVLVAGATPEGENGQVRLFRNVGWGNFENLINLTVPSSQPIARAAAADYDSDGDLDLFLLDENEQLALYQNQGGNANHWIDLQLEGVITSSTKNNVYGIGARLELKVGSAYQLKYVDSPVTHFGLATAAQADVVRVVWTNGVPQNIIRPKGDQLITEKQILKGSCPFLYSWNGHKFEFVTDLLANSPLGLLLDSNHYAPFNPREYVKVSGHLVEPRNGRYVFQFTEELWETVYLDEVELLVVDHPGDVEIYTDERFAPPPYPEFQIYQVASKKTPVRAYDHTGQDVLDRIIKQDYLYVDNFTPGPYQGLTELHSLTLDLGNLREAEKITLFLRGWIFWTDTSINVAVSQNSQITPRPPYLEAADGKGGWVTVYDFLGLPSGKNKTMVVDLTDAFPANDYRIRITTNYQIYWDEIFFSTGASQSPLNITTLEPVYADLHFGGYSKMYRPAPNGPHLYDYTNKVDMPVWRDMAGYFTRYGDVTPLLKATDDMYVIMNSGDEVTIEFNATGAPPLPRGWSRDFIFMSDGWDKDADMNTAYGQTVEPLPFHGMTRYPYPGDEHYPTDAEHVQYLKIYNTRFVSSTNFKNFVKWNNENMAPLPWEMDR